MNNIFDVLRSINPSSPLLELEKDNWRPFVRTSEYELIGLGNGLMGAYPGTPNLTVRWFRGEPEIYEKSIPSLFRINDETERLLDEIKIVEFELVLKTFPQTQFAIQDCLYIDYLGLAQHYGLNTNLLDYSTEPEIAAFFATQKYINGKYYPIESGVGRIMEFFPFLELGNMNSKYHTIGLQCFQRPGIQSACGVEMEQTEDALKNGIIMEFQQDYKTNIKIHYNFHLCKEQGRIIDQAWLFPKEDIATVAELIKNRKQISLKALETYCTRKKLNKEQIEKQLKEHNFTISDNLAFVLSPERRKQLEKDYRNKPYGNAKLITRLCRY